MDQHQVSAQSDFQLTDSNDRAADPNHVERPRFQGANIMQIGPRKATERQKEVLHQTLQNTSYDEIENMSLDEASRLIGSHSKNWRNYPATHWQEKLLRDWNQWKSDMRRGEACDLIAVLKARIAKMSSEELSQALSDAQPRPWHPRST